MNSLATGASAALQRASAFQAPRPQTPAEKKAWTQAQDFEAVFLQVMLTPMFDNLEGEGPLGNEGTGTDSWKGFLVEQHAKSIAGKGGIGLAPQIYRELLRHQESPGHEQRGS